MKRTSFLYLAFVCLMAMSFTSCGRVSGEKYQEEVSKNDSLIIVALQQSNEIAELSSTMNTISAKLDEINGEIYLNNNDTNLLKQRERLMEQLAKVQDKVNQKQEELAALQKKHSKVLKENKELNKTITRLQNDIQSYTATITKYENVMKEQGQKIESLSEELSSAVSNLEEKTIQSAMQQNVISEQDKMLNEGYYIIANKSKLKDLGLVDGGVFSKARLTKGTFDISAFTKVDIREINEIELSSKDAKILTSMPESSYELVKDINKNLKIVIKDPALFWSQTKFLVVMI